MERRTRNRRGALTLLLAGGMLIGACSAAGTGERAVADRADGARRPVAGGERPLPGAPSGPAERRGAEAGDADGGDAKDPAPDYLSTFALDVDTASYGYARRTLDDGRLPDPDTVRPEEFVNSFRQGYRQPEGDGFSVTVDGARAGAGADDWSLVRVGLATRAADRTGERPPAALTFVIDTSGSMAEPGRLDLVRNALGILTDELRDGDSVSLVTFSDEARTRLPMTRLKGNRTRIRDIVGGLEAGASTDLAAGVERGYAEAVEGHREGANNRVVLLSDALANTGETQADAVLERIGDARREYGITLFGVGVGSDYGDALMERLTDQGDGDTTYIADEAQAREVFVDQLPAHVELRARDAKAQVAFDRKTVRQFRLIGYENRKIADEDFRDDGVDGGEAGPGHTVTALYAVRLREGAFGHVATATVRWLDPKTRKARESTGSVGTGAVDGALWDGADPRLQVTAVAAYFADTLRGGDLPGTPALGELAVRARKLAATTEDGSVAELATAVEQADRIKGRGDRPAGTEEGELG